MDITTIKNIDENHPDGKTENDQNGMSPTTIALIIAVILCVIIITVTVVICLRLKQKGLVFRKTRGKTSY